MKPIIFMLILWQLHCSMFAGVNNEENVADNSSLTLLSGIGDSYIKDLYLAPGIFSGAVFSSEISYELNSDISNQKILLKYITGGLSSDSQPGKITQKSGVISYEYAIRLHPGLKGNSPFEIYIGGGISSFISNLNFLLANDDGQFIDQSWYWSHSINFIAYTDYFFLGADILTIRMNIPVFSVVSRPENGHWMNKRNQNVIYKSFFNAALNGRGEFFWDNFNADFSIDFAHFISDKAEFRCAYLFRYTSSEKPLRSDMFSNSLLVGFGFRF